ncbi:MAG: AbrB/MazE/SpoVT family DNA-binding domain-containing protein [Terracidiphilus sp.]
MYSVMMGKRGTEVIPAELRKRFHLQEGSVLLLDERKDGILMRPAITTPVDIEIYTPKRLAEFFLNNVMDKESYLEARKDVEKMGINPGSIDHIPWPD